MSDNLFPKPPRITLLTIKVEDDGTDLGPTLTIPRLMMRWLFPSGKELPDNIISVSLETSETFPPRDYKNKVSEVYMGKVEAFVPKTVGKGETFEEAVTASKGTDTKSTTPTETTEKIICSEHPKYTGQRKPRTTCKACEQMYNAARAKKSKKE